MNKDKRLQITVDISEDGLLPVNVLAEASGLSKAQVKEAMLKGAVWVGKKLAIVKPKPKPIINPPAEADDSLEPDYYGIRARAAQAAEQVEQANSQPVTDAPVIESQITELPVTESSEADALVAEQAEVLDENDESDDGDEVIEAAESDEQEAVADPRYSKPRRLRRIKSKLKSGDQLTLNYDLSVLAGGCADAILVADEGSYSVWYKPAGMLCQGSRWGDHTTLYRWAEKHLEPERTAFIVHRIDRMASGLVVLAHSKKAAVHLTNQFASRKVDKSYQVIVAGDPEFILPHIIDTDIDGKPARTTINEKHLLENPPLALAKVAESLSLLNISIETGKKHQIRRHLAGLGYPVLGDRLYGGIAGGQTAVSPDESPVSDDTHSGIDLQLVAVKIGFTEPGTDIYRCFDLPKSFDLPRSTDLPKDIDLSENKAIEDTSLSA